MPKSQEHLDFAIALANEANDGSIHPAAAIRQLTSLEVDTPQGIQPAFFAVPTAVTLPEHRPGVPMTFWDEQGRRVPFHPIMSEDDGGIVVCVRATREPRIGACAISNFNVPAQRMIEQGAGINSSNYKQLRHGTGGYHYFGGRVLKLCSHDLILDFARDNPYKRIGNTDILWNNGSFRRLPLGVAGPGQYYSENTHAPVATLNVNGKALLALGVRRLAEFSPPNS